MKLTIFRSVLLGVLIATLIVPGGEVAALAQQPTKPQQPPKKPPEAEGEFAIAVEVPLVNVDVVVTDNRGNFIPGLKKQHFRVLEDGVPQTITNFAPTDAPITMVLLIEFRKSLWDVFAYQATNWAYEFLNHLGKDDWVALVSFDLKTHIEVDFTRNKSEIQQHLARMYFPSFSEASLFSAVIETLDRLKDVKGKKSILILASGFDTGLGKNTLDDALKACRQTDTTIFAVGVAKALFEWLEARGAYEGTWGGAARVEYYQAENQLRALARLTGGRGWFPRFQGELPDIFRDVAGHLRNQYSLGYVSTNPKRDGKFRKIKVELVGNDGAPLVVLDQNNKKVKYVVYAREGYAPPKAGVSD